MRRIDVRPGEESSLFEAFRAREPIELTLLEAPSIHRSDLLLAAARFDGVLLVRFDADLSSPLVELACLALAARFPRAASLDLRGALLSPLVARLGARETWRLVAKEGPLLPAEAVLAFPRAPGPDRSPLALAAALEALGAPPSGREVPLARELALFGLLLSAQDRIEGVRAFRERRRPRFDW